MTRNDYIAIGAGLVVGLLVIRWMNRKADTSDKTPAAADVPSWAAGDKTLTDIWMNSWS